MNKAAESAVTSILNAIDGVRDATVSVQTLMQNALQSDPDIIVECAIRIDMNNPDRAVRNGKLSVLRMQMRRASAALKLETSQTVRKVKGTWKLLDVETTDPDTAEAKKVERAVAIVADHIRDRAVMAKLRELLPALGWTPPTAKTRGKPRKGAQPGTVMAH
jgi:hypothetical protein